VARLVAVGAGSRIKNFKKKNVGCGAGGPLETVQYKPHICFTNEKDNVRPFCRRGGGGGGAMAEFDELG
jgi:hypothetical protein